MESGTRRMAGKFFVVPFEVYDKLQRMPATTRWIYLSILRHQFIEEDWTSEGSWVKGNIRTSKTEIMRLGGVSDGAFYHEKGWKALTEAGLVQDNDDGSITLPMLKKKIDITLSPAQVKEMQERLERLEDIVFTGIEDAAKKRIKSAKSEKSTANFAGKSANFAGKSANFAVTSFKEEKDKDLSLSSDNIISGFYRGIGQAKISRQKRERAFKVFKKLRNDGFSVLDIAYAVKWTLENAKQELYDFSIIEHTIGQAIAAREKEEAESRQIEERERKEREEKERIEREEEELRRIEAHRDSLSPEERAELREKAIAEISESGEYKKEFVSDLLIEIKEKEILRRKLEKNGSGTKDGP